MLKGAIVSCSKQTVQLEESHEKRSRPDALSSIRIRPGTAGPRCCSLRSQGGLRGKAGPIPAHPRPARAREGPRLLRSGHRRSELPWRLRDEDWAGWSMGGRQQAKFLFLRFRGTGGASRVCEPKPAILAAYNGLCAFHSGSGEGVLLPHATLFGERPALEY